MTREQAAIKLLALGQMTRAEFVAVTGWSVGTCLRVIARLRDRGVVRMGRAGGRAVWSLRHPVRGVGQ